MPSLSKINYPPGVLSYIQNALQIAFLGELQFACPALAGTYGFHQELLKWGVPEAHIHTTLTAAENATLGDRNDVVVAMPGLYLEAASVGWDKDHTHLVGMGGPNQWGHYRASSLSNLSNTMFYTTDTAIVEVLNLTGHNCQFHNAQFSNHGNHDDCKSGVLVNGYGNYFKGCSILGQTTANQNTSTTCGSLYIGLNADYVMFDNCIIGSNTYQGTRSGVLSSVIRFVTGGASGPQNGEFKNCKILSRSAEAECAAVAWDSQASADRLWYWDNCVFDNFWINWGGACNTVFYVPPGGWMTCTNLLHHCSANGYTEWQANTTSGAGNRWVASDMPASYSGGGLTLVPSTDFDG